MAKQLEGVYEKLIDCGKEEFLQKGYKDASLRVIADNAKTSTSSIYVRFGDKEGLFSAIVKPTIIKFEEMFINEIEKFNRDESVSNDSEKMFLYTINKLDLLVESIYSNFDEFKLLICCSDGTEYSDFMDLIIEVHSNQTLSYIEEIGNDAIISGRLTKQFLHMLLSAFWSGIFEVVKHDMNKEVARKYIGQIKRFYRCGWRDIFYPTDNV